MRSIVGFVLAVALAASAHAAEQNPFDRFDPPANVKRYSTPNWQDWEWQATGPAEVIDGDTLRLRGVKVRLWGIDAPEIGQVCETTHGVPYDCGVAAKVRLDQLIDGREVRCFGFNDGLDRYGRQLAICHVWEIYNLNAQMVTDGWAFDYCERPDDPRRCYSGRHYDYAEAMAKGTAAGMWKGRFVAPWDWRKRRKEL